MNINTPIDQLFMEQLHKAIEDHISDQKFSAENLARELGVSKSQLHRKLQVNIGKSASQLIREARLEKGKELLETGEFTVSEVAYQVGFNSPNYFNTCFHDLYGYTPGETKFQHSKKKMSKLFHPRKIIVLSAVVLAIMGIVYYSEKVLSKVDEPKRVVVLPPKNNTGIDTLDWLISEIHSSLIRSIGAISTIEVISPWTSKTYRDTDKSMKEIASENSADYLIDFSVTCLGDNICFPMSLYEPTPKERQIWNKEFTHSKNQILNLYNQMAKEIAEEIKVKIKPQEEQLLAESTKVDEEAYDAYIRGLFYLDQIDAIAFNSAERYFNLAIEKDSTWALPYVGLSRVWLYRNQLGIVTPSVAIPKIYQYRDKALYLNPLLPESHGLKAGIAFYIDWDWEKCDTEFRKALEFNNSDALVQAIYAHFLMCMRMPDEALYHANQALKLDPLRPLILSLVAIVMTDVGDHQSAIEYCMKALSIDPNFIFAMNQLGSAYYASGDYDSWIETWKHGAKYFWSDEEIANIINICHREGHDATIKAMIQLNENAAMEGSNYSKATLAQRYFQIGIPDKMLDQYEEMYQSNDPTLPYVATSGFGYQKLKDNPRYIALLKKMNLPYK